MTPRPLALAALLALSAAGCTSYGWNPNDTLWQPNATVSVGDNLYTVLPAAGLLARIDRATGEATVVPLGSGQLGELQVSPDGASLLVNHNREQCRTTLDGEEDCDRVERVPSMAVVRDAEVAAWFELPSAYGPLTFSPDGRFAVASVDPDAETVGEGPLNLSSLRVLDLQQGEDWSVSVGFRTERVLFTSDAAGAVDGAIVLSRNEVAVLDLTVPNALADVTFPLTLDADLSVQPVGVSLTPDAGTALITLQNSQDLYALDLVNPSVNILSLDGQPSAMAVSETTDQTVITYTNRASVSLLEHSAFGIDPIALDEPMNGIALADDYAVLYSTVGRQDIYRLDLDTGRLYEQRLAFPPVRAEVTPDLTHTLLFNGSPTAPRLEVVDLRLEDGELLRDDPVPFALEGLALDVAFAERKGGSTALILQSNVDALVTVDLPELALGEVALPAPAQKIGVFEDGTFWIAHNSPLGLISFYTPGQDLVTIGGFATESFLDRSQSAAVEAQ